MTMTQNAAGYLVLTLLLCSLACFSIAGAIFILRLASGATSKSKWLWAAYPLELMSFMVFVATMYSSFVPILLLVWTGSNRALPQITHWVLSGSILFSSPASTAATLALWLRLQFSLAHWLKARFQSSCAAWRLDATGLAMWIVLALAAYALLYGLFAPCYSMVRCR